MTFTINKSIGEHKLLVCFLGWASFGDMLNNLDIDGYDIVSLYDYRDDIVPSEFLEIVKKYGEVSVLAWSYGVFVAEQVALLLPKVKYALAINGVPMPLSARYGISPRVLNLTIKNLDPDKFYERMCAEEYAHFSPCGRTLEELREELVYLCGWFDRSAERTLSWSMALVGERDVIFSYRNILNYWQENSTFVALEVCDIPHYPFGALGLEKIKAFYSGR